ncbi:MAG: hypothetical protein AAB367_03475 [Patescibacteria group bacterium]
MENQERLQDYELSANQWQRWLFSAESVLKASYFLQKIHDEAFEKIKSAGPGGGTAPHGFGLDQQSRYFKGKSLELYLKCLFIKSGKLITNGRGTLTLKTHNLVDLASKVSFKLSLEETNTLNKLSDAVTFWGTYPVPLKHKKWRQNVPGMGGIQPVYVWSEADENNFSAVLERVQRLVGPLTF